MDGLPLALATAGAYLDQVSTSFAEYLHLYKNSWAKLQRTTPQISSYEDRQLYSTWQLSLDHVEQRNSDSAKLLKLWAYFDNQDLWFELLREVRFDAPEWLCRITEDELSFNQALRVLCDLGLVEVDKSLESSHIETKGYGMHSCVHSWTVHVVNQEWDAELADLALWCVGSHIPDEESQHCWAIRRRLLQHAGRCLGDIVDGRTDYNGRGWILERFGRIFSQLGRFDEAEKMLQRALQDFEETGGSEHITIFNMIYALGNLYTRSGDLSKAEKMYQQALQGFKKTFGPEHESVLSTFNSLGSLYRAQGRLDEAERTYQQALQGYAKTRKLEKIERLAIVNNPGILYDKAMGQSDEAEKTYQQALQGDKKALRSKYTLALNTVNNLGNLYQDMERLDEAEKAYQQALQGYEEIWGLEHILTLDTCNNLGTLYEKLGCLDEAEKMYQRALQGYEKAMGRETVKTYRPALNAMDNLAIFLRKTGRLEEAEEMYSRALSGFESVYGHSHERCQHLREIFR